MKAKIGKKTAKASKVKYLWNNRYYYRAHRLALEGLSDQQISTVLQVSPEVFSAWKKKRPSLRDAIKEGREERKAMKNNLTGHIFDRLSDPAREVWERLVLAWNEADVQSRERKLRSVLNGQDDTAMKSLFLHAVAFSKFNPSEAMRMVGVSKRQVNEWASSDPQFLEAMDEVEFHKKQWMQGKLLNLVEANHDGAILFVNRTYNADMGYSPKSQVVSTVNHVHSGDVSVTLDSVSRFLDADTLEKLHRAVQALRLEHSQKQPVIVRPALTGVPVIQDMAMAEGEVLQEGSNAD